MGDADRSEAALWSRAGEGDADAFGGIFDLHRDRVFRHAYGLLRNRADAEDAAGAAFLELWRRRSAVRIVNGSVLPWLLVSVTNVCRNLERSRRRHRRLLDALPHSDDHPSAEETALGGLTMDAELAAALAALPPADAALFALVALEDHPVAEAAAVLGIRPGAARTRLHRIRTRLQRDLGQTSLAGYIEGRTI